MSRSQIIKLYVPMFYNDGVVFCFKELLHNMYTIGIGIIRLNLKKKHKTNIVMVKKLKF